MRPTALNASAEALDDEERHFVGVIREHGWFHTHVIRDDDGPGFSYTTGFWVTLGHPEIIVFSLKDEVASAVLWDIYRSIVAGNRPLVGTPSDLFANMPMALFPVSTAHYHDHLGWSRWFYGCDDFPTLQMVWPDRSGAFPWQPGFDAEAFGSSQPDLTASGWRASLTRE